MAIRSNVATPSKVRETWAFRRDVDAYTGLAKHDVVRAFPENDHCVEVQMLSRAVSAANADAGGLGRSVALSGVVRLFNSPKNLNVTTRAVNRAKGGAVRACCNRERLLAEGRDMRALTLQDAVRRGHSGRALVDDGTVARIERAMAAAYDAYEDDRSAADDEFADAREARAGISEHLQALLLRMGVL